MHPTFQFLARYCDRYAEPLAQGFYRQQARLLQRSYQFVLCVPAYDEDPSFIAPLLDAICADVLVILVFNAPVGTEFAAAQARTLAGLRSLTSSPEAVSLVPWNSQVDVLAVDCCTQGRQLPAKEGVGLARKIAGDLAVVAIAHQKVLSPWIYCTDADVQLPSDYFTAIPTDATGSAALYPFSHQPAHDNILQYEISLRYYVLQLHYSGSPYAFQTVGSSMATQAKAYASVRGFPKRSAAEDFYILNKLAKTGAIIRLKTQPLVLSSRRSHRVPFGTGAAMNRLQEHPEQRLYHPNIFQHLGEWLDRMEFLWRDREQVQTLGLETWWQQHPLSSDQVLPILIELGLPKVLHQAYRQCHDLPHFCYYLHVWFDAFRTLRFIHLMRDRGLGMIAIADLPKLAPHLQLQEFPLAYLLEQLAVQEAQLPEQTGATGWLHR